MPPSAIEAIIFDLIHRPITPEVVTRILSHELLTPEFADKTVETLYHKEALSPEYYDLYLSFYARHGDIQKVKSGIEKASSYKIPVPKDQWHSTLARGFAVKNRIPDAMKHLKTARDLGVCDSFAHDAVVLALITHARELGNELARHKQESGEKVKSKKTEILESETAVKIREFLKTAVETARVLRDNNLQMNDRTHQMLNSMLTNSHLFEDALEMMKWANECKPNPGNSAGVAEAQFFVAASHGKLDEAMGLLDEMKKVTIDHYVTILNNCAESGDLEKWKKISVDIRHLKGVRPPIYGKLIDILGKKGGFKDMEEVFKEMKVLFGRQGVSHVVYSSMMHIYVNAGNVERAQVLFNEMRVNGVEPNEVSFCALLRGWQARGEFARCDSLLAKAQSKSININFSQLISPMIPYWAQQPGAFKRCVYWLLIASQHLRTGTPQNSLFNMMLNELAKRGDMNSCVELTHEMRNHNIRLSADSYSSLFLAASLAKLEGAYEVLRDGMVKDNVLISPILCVEMLRYCLGMKGDMQVYEEVVKELNNSLQRFGNESLSEENKKDLADLLKQVKEMKETKDGKKAIGKEKEESRESGTEVVRNNSNTIETKEIEITSKNKEKEGDAKGKKEKPKVRKSFIHMFQDNT